MPRYNPATIEPKWQKYWEENQTFAAPRMPEGRKLYVLDMFPYPSGDGLHVGHPEGYTATDIVCRFAADAGHERAAPDGLGRLRPAGRAARHEDRHATRASRPRRTSPTFRRQMQDARLQLRLGPRAGHDRPGLLPLDAVDLPACCSTPGSTTTQQRGRPIAELPIPAEVEAAGRRRPSRRYQDEHRLAYQTEAPVNWCPALGTVLANEEVIGGESERGGHPVVRLPLRQWMLRITAYADRLEKDLERLDWSGEHQGAAAQLDRPQRRRGGRFLHRHAGEPTTASRAEREFKAWLRDARPSGFPRKPGDDVLRIYTTRPDTLFGATYMVLAPEHPFVERLTHARAGRRRCKAYCEQAARKSDLDRTDLAKDKTGVFTGAYAINPVNGEPIPIWIADYVLISYGTGAIMAVPAHDTRDFEFAKQFGLPIVPVVDPGDAAGVDREAVLAGKAVFHRRRHGDQLRARTTACRPPSSSRRSPPTWPQRGVGRAGGQLQAPRLALQPAALLGRAVPDPARAGRRRASRPG